MQAMVTGKTHHHVFDTALGPCGVAWTAQGLTHVQFADASAAATEKRLVARAASVGAARRFSVAAALASANWT